MLQKEFTVTKKVYLADTDVTGIVYYARHLEWLEMARVEFIAQIYKPLTQMFGEDKISFVPIRVELDYKAPARFEETLTIHLWVRTLDKIKMVLGYRITKEAEAREIIVAEALITMVCVDLQKGSKPCRIPLQMAEVFKKWVDAEEGPAL